MDGYGTLSIIFPSCRGRLSESGVLKLFVSTTLVLWRGTLLGSPILMCTASSLGWRNCSAHAVVAPARAVHRSRQDDRVVTHGVIMEGVGGRDRLLEWLRSHQPSITMHIP